MPIRSYLLAVFLALFAGIASAQEPKHGPPGAQESSQIQLMLETGGHTALIRALDFTPDETRLVSVSEDKTIRVWDIQSGTSVRTLRGEIGPGSQGSLNALAVSPDGKYIAVGGYHMHEEEGACDFCGEIRIFDIVTGTIVALLNGGSKSIATLAFSRDGTLLVAGHNDGAFIWDVHRAALVRTLSVPDNPVSAALFTANDTQVITGDSAGVVRLWRISDGTQMREQHGHRVGIALAVSPSDGRIYTGGYSDRTIKEWSSSLDPIRTVFTENGYIQRLAISADGKTLASSSGAAGEGAIGDPDPVDHKVRIRLHDLVTGETKEYRGHKDEDIIPGLAISTRSGLVAAGGGIQNEIHIFDPKTLQVKSVLKGTDLAAPVTGVAFSDDGSKIAWGQTVSDPSDYSRYYLNRGPLEFEMSLPGPTGEIGAPKPVTTHNYRQGVKQRNGLSIEADAKRKAGLVDFKVSTHGGGTFSIDGGIADYTFAPSTSLLVVSKHFSELVSYDFTGSELGRFIGHTDTILGTAISRDESLLISGAFDGTLRFWNLRSRELIATLFVTKSREWVIWTPQGYYASSPDGDKLVGWQINRGSGKTADYYTARQLRTHFYRPDIVADALRLASATEAVNQARRSDQARTRFDLQTLLERKPPALNIANAVVSGAVAELSVEIGARADEDIILEAFVNGARLPDIGTRGFIPVGAVLQRKVTVPLSKGDNVIMVRATNTAGITEKQATLFNSSSGALDKKGTLFVVAVGVDKYPYLPKMCGGPNRTCDLNYAGMDAKAFVEQMLKVAGPLYERVEARVLTNGAGGVDEPTASNIVNALRILKQSREPDTVMVFLSGHGTNEEIKARKNYLFLPTDAQRDALGWIDTSVFDWALLERALGNASGRRILFVDTCHAANSYSSQIIKNAHDENIAVFSAADGDTVAQERSDLGHGVFTYVILRALRGEAAKEKEVRLLGFAEYIDENVRKLTNDAQKPEYNIQRVKNYIIARMQ